MGIGIAPGRTEWNKTREPFTGPAGKLLDGTLSATGWTRDKIFLTNLVCWWEDSPTQDEIAICKPRLDKEIEACNPNLIVLFGGIASSYFLGKYKRGRLYFRDNRWFLPTFHPAAFIHDREHKLDIADFARDLSKIKLFAERDYGPDIVDYKVADNVLEAHSIMWSLSGSTAIDVETSYDGKDFAYPKDGLIGTDDSKLLCFSVSNANGTWVIPGRYINGIRKGWGERDEVEWIMHGGMFDVAQIRRLLGEELKISEDTLLMSYSLDERGGDTEENERPVGIHGLKGLAGEFLGASEYDVKVLEVDAPTLHEYNAKDSYYTYELCQLFKPLQEADNVRDMYENILIPGTHALSQIQAYGVYIDKKKLFELGAKWSEKWLDLHQRLIDEANRLGFEGEINLNSWQQIQRLLFDILKCKPHPRYGKATRKEVMEWLASKGVEWCQILLEWRAVDHVFGTYIRGIEDDIKYDGRVHPIPVMHGTISGRLSYRKPPVQTLPKHGVSEELAEIRAIFAAASGYEIIEADYKQAELYATAYLSGDEVMLEALKSGDAHGATAKQVFEVDETHEFWSAYRELGKLFNFGTLYNRQAKSYADNPFQGRKPPKGLENFRLSKKKAQEIIDKQFVNWPKVHAFQKEVIREAKRTGEQQTVTGRKRRYWLATWKTANQAVNFFPQNLAHEYLFNSLVKLHWALAEFDAHVLFEVHDAIVVESPVEWRDEVVSIIRSVMTEPKFGFPGIPCDISAGRNWYEVEKI